MQKKQTHVAYGLITALVLIIMNLGIVLSHQSGNKALGWLPLLAMMVGIIMNCIAFAKANNGDVTFGQDFMSGFKATMIIAVAYTAWAMISLALFPQIKQDAFDMAISALLGTLIMGAIAALIGAAVAKKNPAPAQMM